MSAIQSPASVANLPFPRETLRLLATAPWRRYETSVMMFIEDETARVRRLHRELRNDPGLPPFDDPEWYKTANVQTTNAPSDVVNPDAAHQFSLNEQKLLDEIAMLSLQD